ncbi:MAG: hypothetical protein U9Q82_01090 [Chloroflexota bacterium]|nr:hypothetical protein [Chloroflexota bacterium]
MDKKTTGIIATVTTVLLCGCPGLCLCIFGAVTAAGVMPYDTEFNGVTDSGIVPSGYGFAGLCLALILILIPVGVGFFTLREKSDDDLDAASIDVDVVEEPPTDADEFDQSIPDDDL